MPTLVQDIRTWLDRLSRADSKAADNQECLHDALRDYVKQQDPSRLVAAIPAAIGRSKTRRRQSVFLYAELTEQQSVVEALRDLFDEADDDLVVDLLETIRHFTLSSLDDCVTATLKSDRPNHVKNRAIAAAAALRSDTVFPVLLELTRDTDTPFVRELTVAFMLYAKPECSEFLEQIYNRFADTVSLRIWAAWGLCRLGAVEPFDYLVNCVSGVIATNSLAEPIRAAQAICDIRGFPFTWSAKAPAKVLARLREV